MHFISIHLNFLLSTFNSGVHLLDLLGFLANYNSNLNRLDFLIDLYTSGLIPTCYQPVNVPITSLVPIGDLQSPSSF